MYVTWAELLQFDLVICAVITLTVTVMIYIGKKK